MSNFEEISSFEVVLLQLAAPGAKMTAIDRPTVCPIENVFLINII